MATKIGPSVLDDANAATAAFTPGGPFKVLSKKGTVRLLESIDGADYIVTEVLPLSHERTQEAREVLISNGCVLYVNPLDSTASFKLASVGGKATAEAWLI